MKIRGPSPTWYLLAGVLVVTASHPTDTAAQAFQERCTEFFEQPCDCTGGSIMEASFCTQWAYEEADSVLNAVYRAAMAAIDRQNISADRKERWRTSLRDTQRAWIAFKESDCRLVAIEWAGLRGENVASLSCLTRHTEARAEDLRYRYIEDLYNHN